MISGGATLKKESSCGLGVGPWHLRGPIALPSENRITADHRCHGRALLAPGGAADSVRGLTRDTVTVSLVVEEVGILAGLPSVAGLVSLKRETNGLLKGRLVCWQMWAGGSTQPRPNSRGMWSKLGLTVRGCLNWVDFQHLTGTIEFISLAGAFFPILSAHAHL